MPEYYKLVYPDTQYSDTTAVTADKPLIKQREGVAPAGELLLQETADEQDLSFDVETILYKATIRNKNGGSFTFFELNNHALNDSELVNLINDRNQQNLDVSFRSVDGDLITLSSGWKTDNRFDINVFTGSKTVSFYKTINNKKITKDLTFYPNRYVVDIIINMSRASEYISQNVASISWQNGLPLTEPNINDELTYYSAVVYQGDESYYPKTKPKGQAKLEKMLYPTDWTGVRTKYFFSALVPEEKAAGAEVLAIEEGNLKEYSVGLLFNTLSPVSYTHLTLPTNREV